MSEIVLDAHHDHEDEHPDLKQERQAEPIQPSVVSNSLCAQVRRRMTKADTCADNRSESVCMYVCLSPDSASPRHVNAEFANLDLTSSVATPLAQQIARRN